MILGDEIYAAENSLDAVKSGYKYDIITMFHVHYYWKTPEKRILVMKKLLKHLNPKHGMLFILILDQGKDNQIQLRKETKSKLSMVEIPKHESNTVLANQVSMEMETVLKSCQKQKTIQRPYQILLDFDLSDKTDKTNQLISYVLSINFKFLHRKMQDFVTDWIKSNCFKVDSKEDESNQVYQMRQSVRMLLYTLTE